MLALFELLYSFVYTTVFKVLVILLKRFTWQIVSIASWKLVFFFKGSISGTLYGQKKWVTSLNFLIRGYKIKHLVILKAFKHFWEKWVILKSSLNWFSAWYWYTTLPTFITTIIVDCWAALAYLGHKLISTVLTTKELTLHSSWTTTLCTNYSETDHLQKGTNCN